MHSLMVLVGLSGKQSGAPSSAAIVSHGECACYMANSWSTDLNDSKIFARGFLPADSARSYFGNEGTLMLKTRGNRITWLGHATFQITLASGKVVLLDAWVNGNPACPKEAKKLKRVDAMLITHGHSDHIDDALAIAKKFKPHVVAIYETAAWFEGKGVKNVIGIDKGGTTKVGEIEVTMVHAVHSNGIREGKKIVYGGEPAGYVVRLPGGLTLYHAGDTAVFGDMKLIAELYAPEVAMLPIGDFYTMGPREAAMAVRLLNVKHVIPMHYGTFPVLTGTPEELKKLTQDIPGLEIHVMKPGESIG